MSRSKSKTPQHISIPFLFGKNIQLQKPSQKKHIPPDRQTCQTFSSIGVIKQIDDGKA